MKCFLRAILLTMVMAVAATAGQAQMIFTATLDGPSESPPNASPGTGTSTLTFDPVAHTLRLEASFSGLLGTTMAAHIHGPTTTALTGTASVATQVPSFTGFPLGVTSGTYDHTFDTLLASTYNPSFFTGAGGGTGAGAEAALIAAISAGKAYLNIHTSSFAGGEIRGFYVQAVPEPGTFALLGGMGLGGALLAIRRRRR